MRLVMRLAHKGGHYETGSSSNLDARPGCVELKLGGSSQFIRAGRPGCRSLSESGASRVDAPGADKQSFCCDRTGAQRDAGTACW